MCVLCADDSDDEREVSRKRTVRQAASKAVSKQREILLGDGGSEDEEHEDQEESYMDRMYQYTTPAPKISQGLHMIEGLRKENVCVFLH